MVIKLTDDSFNKFINAVLYDQEAMVLSLNTNREGARGKICNV